MNIGLLPHFLLRTEPINCPPKGIKYINLCDEVDTSSGYIVDRLPLYKKDNIDIFQSHDHLFLSENNYIHSCAQLYSAVNFFIDGKFFPLKSRVAFLRRILESKRCKKIVTWSKAAYEIQDEQYDKIYSNKIINKCVCIYPAINITGQSKKINGDKLTILFIGGQFFRKGGEQLVNAFNFLSKKYDIKLILITRTSSTLKDYFFTNGNYHEIEKLIKNNKNIEYFPNGVTNERIIDEILPSSDIFVLPTLREWFGYVNIEAMGAGLPVITTDLPGISEAVSDNINGFLIKISQSDFIKNRLNYKINGKIGIPKNFSDYLTRELIDRLEVLITDSSLRKKMSKESLRIAHKKFSYKIRGEKMRVLYEECV